MATANSQAPAAPCWAWRQAAACQAAADAPLPDGFTDAALDEAGHLTPGAGKHDYHPQHQDCHLLWELHGRTKDLLFQAYVVRGVLSNCSST